jgi:hypothetical protein
VSQTAVTNDADPREHEPLRYIKERGSFGSAAVAIVVDARGIPGLSQ